MLWINFLHFYQPANNDEWHIREATKKSYLRLIRALEEHPQIKFTVNIAGSLIIRWEYAGRFDILRRLKALAERGQIELVGTAAYHPLLPLIGPAEARRQIRENEELLRKYFGQAFRPKGFFLPEMAYSPAAARLVRKLGYEYLILDEMALAGAKPADPEKIYVDRQSGLEIIFRSRKISNTYVPAEIGKLAAAGFAKPAITATDAELYGLRFQDPDAILEKLLDNPAQKTMTISAFRQKRPREKASLRASNWESTLEDLKKKRPFHLWHDKANALHQELWKLARLAETAQARFARDRQIGALRWHLARGLSSCTFWWASGHDFRHVYGPLAWCPDEIERGANELIRAVRSLNHSRSRAWKTKAEKSYQKIIRLIWETHWQKYWKK